MTLFNLKLLHKINKKRNQSGASLVEVLVAIGITAIMLPALLTALISANAAKPAAQQQILAEGYLRSLTEQMRSVREGGWSNIATNGTYHPVTASNTWALSSGSSTVGNFTLQVVISDIQRNSSGGIVSSGGTVDPSTKLATATVSWSKPVASSISSQAIFSRWNSGTTWTQTTQTDFNGGTLTNTVTTNTAGGEVQLADGTPNWLSPSLAGSFNITGNVSGLSSYYATISGTPYAFVGFATGMAIINVSNKASPTLTGTYATTSAVNGIFVNGTAAYLALAGTTNQFTIVNVSNPASPATTGSLTVGGNVAANAVTVSGTSAYIVSNTAGGTNGDFNIVNITNPAAPTITGKLKIGSNNKGVVVSGNFAYIPTDTNNKQLEAVNISNPAAPTAGNTVNMGANGLGVVLSGTNIYVATANNAATGELRIFSISTPGTMTAVGNYEVGGNVNGLAISGNYVQLATGVAAKQIINVNVTTPATPTLASNFTLSAAGNAVFTNGFYAYVGSADTTKELQIVYAGPQYQASGTFESSSFNAGSTVGFNYLSFTTSQPTASVVKLQVASNTNNSTWNYVGPDGTASTFFTAAGGIPMTAANGQYFKYKAFYTAGTGNASTAVLSDVTLNYTP
ncbi:MAG TPA: beta-propeller domain-containing protein [Candidatus Saccharimonadales bacterium]|nr:beta-propeller domain-containing protein [Candidatus Saccharimonadales bacterium]